MNFSLFGHSTIKTLKNKREQLYRVAYSWCNDASLADDIVNETLYKAIKNHSSLRDKSRLNSWLFKILGNCWHDHLRQLKPNDDIEDIVFTDNETPELLLQQQEIIVQVRKAISLLPMGQRQAITLVDIEGFSYEEVAIILDIPVGTVMSRISRGRILLKDKLLKTKPEQAGFNQEKDNLTKAQKEQAKLRRVK